MKRCDPLAPSSLCGTPFIIFGMKPRTLVPVVSVRYSATPLELPRPWGKRADFELSSSRAVSHALAAMTIRPRVVLAAGVLVDVQVTPVARPSSPTVTSRAIALVTMVRRLRRARAESAPMAMRNWRAPHTRGRTDRSSDMPGGRSAAASESRAGSGCTGC